MEEITKVFFSKSSTLIAQKWRKKNFKTFSPLNILNNLETKLKIPRFLFYFILCFADNQKQINSIIICEKHKKNHKISFFIIFLFFFLFIFPLKGRKKARKKKEKLLSIDFEMKTRKSNVCKSNLFILEHILAFLLYIQLFFFWFIIIIFLW